MIIHPRVRAALAAVALAAAGLAAAVPGAQAADRPAVPALHGRTVALGTTNDVFGTAFTQAPDGAVFFSRGAVVDVVVGSKAPKVAVRAGHTVFALAANSADLFVETGLRVTEYKRANGAQVRHWTLTSPVAAITSAGLYLVGGTLWVWTDWATDGSGLEYAQLSRIHPASAAVHVVDKNAFPADMSADSAGLYYETVRGTTGYLAHANPTTSAVQLRKGPVDAPLTLAGGRLDVLTSGSNSQVLISYNTSTLKQLSSKKVPYQDTAIEGTGLGLLVLVEGCNGFPCSTATVARLNVATGGRSGALRTPGAYQFLNGPLAAVVEVSNVHGTHATLTLVRLSA
jgi:hypothetical protein